MNNLYEIVQIAGLSTALTILLIGFLTFLCREWIKAKIGTGVQHSFDTKIEKLKSQLSHQTDIQLAAHAAGVSAQALGAKDRIEALRELWETVIKVRDERTPFAEMSYLLVDEYRDKVKQGLAKGSSRSITKKDGIDIAFEFVKNIENDIEKRRPFLSAEIWRLFSIYSTFSTRLIYLEAEFNEGRKDELWFEDKATLGLLKQAFSEDTIDKILNTQFKAPFIFKTRLMEMILSEAHLVISGERFGEEALNQSNKLSKALNVIKEKTTNRD